EALLVHHGDVARGQPAFAVEDLGGLFRALPVPLHDLRATHAQLTRLIDLAPAAIVTAHAHFGRGHGHADRAGEDRARVLDVHGCLRHDGRALGQAIAFGDVVARGLVPALGDVALQGHAAGDRQLQVRKIELAEGRVFQEGSEHRVDAGDAGEALL